MNASPELDKLSEALVAAQGRLTNPKTDSTAKVAMKAGGTYSYKYLSLPALLEHTRQTLHDAGLGVIQEVTNTERGIAVTTRIVHASGQWLETGPLALPVGGTSQDHGSAITYGRRYALGAALGLAPDEDDDAATKPRGSGSGVIAEGPTEGTQRSERSVVTNTPVPEQSSDGQSEQGAPLADPPAPSESSTGALVMGKDQAPVVDSPHAFVGDDPNGACAVCHWLMQAEVHDRGVKSPKGSRA